jgi:prephenate dehydratase
MKRVAIQGIKGSYHYQVANEYFKNKLEIIEFLSFDEVANSIKNSHCDFAVMAIENSIAGSIIPNYALIDDLNLKIVGEYYININHQLMALPGTKIKDLSTVSSHPMALLQCKSFFKSYPKITLIEDKDTAEVAYRIQRDKIKNLGAIASTNAAKLYDLEILNRNIQTIKNNETRFVIVSKLYFENNINNKASLKFSLSHKTWQFSFSLKHFKRIQFKFDKNSIFTNY